MSCIKITLTNGATSELYNTIYEQLADENIAVADNFYSFFQSEAFINDFGDWITDYKSGEHITNERVDENGEPILFIDDKTDEFYYLNKHNDRVKYPNKSITDDLTQLEIDTAVN